jgi:hypothetical protein
MPKFCVELIKDVWEKAWVEVEAADEAAAAAAAVVLAEFGEEAKIEWHWDETNSIEAIKVEEVEKAE